MFQFKFLKQTVRRLCEVSDTLLLDYSQLLFRTVLITAQSTRVCTS